MSSVATSKYSHLARVLHWLSAVIILWATVTGLYAAVWAGPELQALISLINISVTTLLIPAFVLRIAYRLVSRGPGPLDVAPGERRVARIGHVLLYALTALVLASGVLMMQHDIQVFDWVSLRRPIDDQAVNGFFADVHRATIALLGLMVVIHVAAVIRHERRGVPVLGRMLWSLPRRRHWRAPGVQAQVRDLSFRDASGHPVFCHGDIGAAHVLAHRMLDGGRPDVGHRLLGRWLERHSGSGSEWVHLHFHMAVFELAVDDWDGAHARFMDHVLPAVAETEDALTDGPALLWRLQLSAPRPVELPWQALRRTALRRMQRPSDPFVELHNLLALAGAGDLENIDRWVRSQPPCEDTGRECLLRRLALALRAYAGRAYEQAAEAFESIVPQLAGFGGSMAQNQLFQEIARASWHPASRAGMTGVYPHAA